MLCQIVWGKNDPLLNSKEQLNAAFGGNSRGIGMQRILEIFLAGNHPKGIF